MANGTGGRAFRIYRPKKRAEAPGLAKVPVVRKPAPLCG